MNMGAFGENLPYVNFHDLNLDWIVREMKEFLDEKSSVLSDIETDKDSAITEIDNRENQAVQTIESTKNSSVSEFESEAERIGDEVIESIPSDYSTLSHNAIKVSTLIAGAYTSGTGIETIDSPVANNLYRLQLTSKPDWFPDTYPTNAQTLYLLDIAYIFSGSTTIYRYIFDELLQVRYRMWKQPYGTWSSWETYDSLSLSAIKVGEIITGSPTGTVLETKNTIIKNTLYRAQLTSQPSWIPDDIPMSNLIRYIIKIEYPWGSSTADTIIVMDETFNKLGFNMKQPSSDWGVWFYYNNHGLTIKVPVSQNTITLENAMALAYYWGNTTVELEDGDYVISTFEGLGMTIGNNVHLLGTSKTRIIAQSPTGLQYWSILYSGRGDFIVENIRFIGSNIRYCIHDDPSQENSVYPANHLYKDCYFYIDNDNNLQWPNNQCIGGGMGRCTTAIIDNCVFEASTPSSSLGLASYHNSSDANAQGKIIVKDSLFLGANGTFRASWYGTSTLITDVYVINSKMGIDVIFSAETLDSTVQNMSLTEWGNTVGNIDPTAGKKDIQSPVSDPVASGTAVEFISGISQDQNGVITPAKKTVRTVSKNNTGLCPALPDETATNKYLRQDGTWAVPANTTYGVVDKTEPGLCPTLPNETATTKYLRQDGTWETPPNTTYSEATTTSAGLMSATDKVKLNGLKAVTQETIEITMQSGIDYFYIPDRTGKSLVSIVGANFSAFSNIIVGFAHQGTNWVGFLKNQTSAQVTFNVIANWVDT